jgi:hypothetical protein
MSVMRVFSGLLLALFAAAPSLAAQRPPVPPVDSTAVVMLRLTDGSDLTGRVVAADDTSLTVVTLAAARVQLPRTSIVSWRPLSGQMSTRGFRPADPNTSRLFFGPTARTLEQGNGYFADYYLFFPVVAYGVHDRVMVSAGMSIIPGLSSQLLYATAKVGVVRSENGALAVGGFYATVPDEADAALGTAYGVATLGNADYAFTFMGGYPFTTQDVAQEPLFMLGAEMRIARRAKFLGELWKFPETSEVPAVFGLRWFGERLAVDFGFAYVAGTITEGWPLIPWVDFAINW